MKRFHFAMPIIAGLLVSSCTTHQFPETVQIPVTASCPKPKIPPKPALPIYQLKSDDTPDKVVKAYAASIAILNGYNGELIHILNAYNNDS